MHGEHCWFCVMLLHEEVKQHVQDKVIVRLLPEMHHLCMVCISR